MVKFRILVSDKKESLLYHAEKQFQEINEAYKDAALIKPGAAKLSADGVLGIRNRVPQTHYMKEFTYDNLMRLYENQHSLIIENAHLLSTASVQALLKFHRENRANVYLYSRIHDLNNAVYPIVSFLADYGYEPEQLEDFAVEQTLEIKKASSLPGKKAKEPKDIDHNKALHVTMANYLKLGPGYLKNSLDENLNAWLEKYTDTLVLFHRLLPRGLSKNSQLFRTAHALLYYRDWILLGAEVRTMTTEQGRTLGSIIHEKSNQLDTIISYCLEGVRIPEKSQEPGTETSLSKLAERFIRNVENAEKKIARMKTR